MLLTTLPLLFPLALTSPQALGPQGQIVVANRGDGTLTTIDVATDTVTNTIALPAGGSPAEPMYVEPAAGLLFVGDRANDRLVAYDPDSWNVVGTTPAGDGVFHMRADAVDWQLWVVNDVDKTLSVVDPNTLQNVATVPVPADLVAAGGKPHDVVVGLAFAYVSVVGVAGGDDFIVQYAKWDFSERGRAAVGKDPHLALDVFNPNLFVPSQGGGTVHVLRRWDLQHVEDIPVAGAHGAWMTRNGGLLYTTNLPGGGAGGLVTIDALNRKVLGTTDSPYPTPHNVASTRGGRKVYVTHSGAAANQVSIYLRKPNSPVPVLIGGVTAGTNPFGITYVR